MNINQNHSGSGDNIAGNKITITQKEAPSILNVSSEKEVIFENNIYKHEFFVDIKNPSPNFKINIRPRRTDLIFTSDEKILQRTGSKWFAKGGFAYYQSYKIVVYANYKLSINENFVFSVDTI